MTTAPKARAAKFAVGASLGALGALVALIGAAIFGGTFDDSPSLLDVELNAGTWTFGAFAFVLGMFALVIGAFLVVRVLRPGIRVGVLLPATLAVGGLLLGIPSIAMNNTLVDFVIEAAPMFDLSVWDRVGPSEPLLGWTARLGILAALVGIVWSIVVGIRTATRKVAASS